MIGYFLVLLAVMVVLLSKMSSHTDMFIGLLLFFLGLIAVFCGIVATNIFRDFWDG